MHRKPKTAPHSAPRIRAHSRMDSQATGTKSMNSTPISRPNHRPLSAPEPAARPLVMRPVTRSSERRPSPTIFTVETSNFSSERRSTTPCASA